MIAYRDFVPEKIQKQGFLKSLGGPSYESLEEALEAANTWINAESIRVINVETVVLPNIWEEEGPADVELRTASGWASWYQFIRVWYESD